MEQFDFIFCGGGAAGLSLAYHLAVSELQNRSMLIIDLEKKNKNDRTWCFWNKEQMIFDSIRFRVWDRLRFISDHYEEVFDLAPYQYNMIRGIDFYNFTRAKLSSMTNVKFHYGNLENIEAFAENVIVTVDGQKYSGEWAFNSLFLASDFLPKPGFHDVKQHFKGWIIHTREEVFNTDVPTMFDFRIPQQGEMRFMYILPFSPNQALVEFTLFSRNLLEDAEYNETIQNFIKTRLGIVDYEILETEAGVIPMTNQPFPRKMNRRTMNIGTRGGRVKPSSGYAFLRIQKDSAAIVRSLIQNRHPFNVPESPARYKVFDTIMLELLTSYGDEAKRVFTALFKNNPIQRNFLFLDEAGAIFDDLTLIASLPPGPFIRSLWKLAFRK